MPADLSSLIGLPYELSLLAHISTAPARLSPFPIASSAIPAVGRNPLASSDRY